MLLLGANLQHASVSFPMPGIVASSMVPPPSEMTPVQELHAPRNPHQHLQPLLQAPAGRKPAPPDWSLMT